MGFFSSVWNGISNLGGDILDKFGPLTGATGDAIGLKGSNDWQKDTYRDQMGLARAQFQFQQDYAKNRLQWQIEDAKKAGLHPMVAAGLSPTSFSPVSAPSIPDLSSVASNLGQNLDYALTKAKTQKQQAEALEFMRQSNELELQGKHLDNELKQMEIMSMMSRLTNSGPAAPDATGSGLGIIGGQQDAVSPYASPTVRSSSPDAVSLMVPVVSGDFVIPVYNPDIADPLSESIHNSTTAKLNYMDAVSRGDILAPPRSSWSKEQARKVDAGTHRWKFDAAAWRWALEPNVSYSRDKRTAGGRIMPYRYQEMYK